MAESFKFRKDEDLYPKATGQVNLLGLPQPGLRTIVSNALTPSVPTVTSASTAPPLQQGVRPAPITETLRPAPIPDSANLGGGGVGGQFAPSPLVVPTVAQLSTPGVTATQPMRTPPGAAVPQDNLLPVSTPPVTARELFPGVTEVTAPDSTRAFTNLLPGSATPAQVTGFRNAAIGGAAPVPGQLGTARPLAGGDVGTQNRLLNDPAQLTEQIAAGQFHFGPKDPVTGAETLVRGGAPAQTQALVPAQTGGFRQNRPAIENTQFSQGFSDLLAANAQERNAPATGTLREILQGKIANAERMGTVGGARAAGIYRKQLSNLDKSDRANRTVAVQEGNLAVAQAKAVKEAKEAATKGGKFTFDAGGEIDVLTGLPKNPSIKFGDQQIDLTPEDSLAINADARSAMADFRAQFPQDTTPIGDLLQHFYEEAARKYVGATSPAKKEK